MPLESVSDWPKPFHVLPFQPSPNESDIESVHETPAGGMGSIAENGAHVAKYLLEGNGNFYYCGTGGSAVDSIQAAVEEGLAACARLEEVLFVDPPVLSCFLLQAEDDDELDRDRLENDTAAAIRMSIEEAAQAAAENLTDAELAECTG